LPRGAVAGNPGTEELIRLLVFVIVTLVAVSAEEIRLEDYPEMDDVQWGHLRHIARMAGQLDGDWNWMGTKEPDQEGDDGYRYQLSGAASALALAHYHRIQRAWSAPTAKMAAAWRFS
jgi:hypothetical protein